MNVPAPRMESKKIGPRLVWIVPIAAAIVGLSLLVNHWRTRGPQVTITFQSGEGLDVGKTLVKFRDVTIGRVSGISLSNDRSTVTVTADLVRSAADLASENSHFWVVRPRIGVGWASGLDTLLSGAYIAVEPGVAGPARTHFTGLEVPPPLAHGGEGRRVVLQAQDLGSLNVGGPVYFRRYKVGQIIDEHLDPDARGATVVVFIDAPNDRFVTRNTRFWNASGIDLSLGAEGMKLKSESVATLVAGGVAFDAGIDAPEATPPRSGADFTLYKDEASALAPPDGEPRLVKMRFDQPLRGLMVGAPVEFIGVDIGSVAAIDIGYEPKTQKFPVFVTAKLFPRRMGLAYTMLQEGHEDTVDYFAELAGQLVARGLRVQPRSGSLLTGRLYLALDFVPEAPKVAYNAGARPVELPTAPSNLGEIEVGVARLVKKFNDLPLERVVDHANDDLKDLHGTLEQLNGNVLPAATVTLTTMHQTLEHVEELMKDDSTFRDSVDQTLGDAQRTLLSVKALADYLDRHPEALIKGRAADTARPKSSQTRREPAP
jgi:paraquat-inducible protein B